MASDSVTPPVPTGNGNAKYIVVLLLLIAGGLGVYLATSGGEKPPAPVATPEPPKNPEPSTALSDTPLVVPTEETPVEDAAAPEPEVKKPTRVVTSDAWSCEGDISTTDVRKVVAETQTAMRSCYERRLRNDNQLQGSINLQVRVGKDGKVDNTRVRGSLRDQEVLKCVQGMARSWAFPSPTGGNCAVLDVPYHFTPKN